MGNFQIISAKTFDEIKNFAKDKILVLTRNEYLDYKTWSGTTSKSFIVFDDMDCFYKYLAAHAIGEWRNDVDSQDFDTYSCISSNGFSSFTTTNDNNNITDREFFAAFDGNTLERVMLNIKDFEKATEDIYKNLDEDKLLSGNLSGNHVCEVIGCNPIENSIMFMTPASVMDKFEEDILGGNTYYNVQSGYIPDIVLAKSDWTCGLSVCGSASNKLSEYHNDIKRSLDEALELIDALDEETMTSKVLAYGLDENETKIFNAYVENKKTEKGIELN